MTLLRTTRPLRLTSLAHAAMAVLLTMALPADTMAANAPAASNTVAATLPRTRVELAAQLVRSWNNRSFADIEPLDQAYGTTGQLDPDGYPLREWLDQAIQSRLAAASGNDAEWNATRDAIYRWADQWPKSALAPVTLANLYAARAWRIRGNSDISALPWEQQQALQANVNAQKTTLLSTRDVSQNHPGWYLSMARVLQITGAPEPEFRSLLREGLERFPKSFALYAVAIEQYAGLWRSQQGTAERFAYHASARLPSPQAEEMYARAFGYAANLYPSEIINFECPRVLRGFDGIVRRHKTPFNTHQAARAAFECKDRARAARLLRGTSGAPPAGVWGQGPTGVSRFNEAKKWAR